MSEKKKQLELVSQQKALTQFLDSLLMEIPEDVVETKSSTSPRTQIVADDQQLVTAEVEIDIQREGAPEQVSETSIIPEWGSVSFKALFFKVGEMTLAAPLEKLGRVLTDFSEIKQLPGRTERYLGVVVHRGNTIRVVDFERFIAETGETSESPSDNELPPPSRIILIDNDRIGIACREVAEVEELSPGAVRWRQGTSKRPWYCGIVIERMCALLDIDTLVAILNDSREK